MQDNIIDDYLMCQQENFLIDCDIPLNMGHTPTLEMLQCGENVCLGSDVYDNFYVLHVKSHQSCLTLFKPMDCNPSGSLSTGLSRQEY